MTEIIDTLEPKKIRGVNLGGWLVLEKWMTPSLFEDLNATDETSLCVELGPAAESRLAAHWNRFITEADFVWLSEIGINAVRIPVGYWIFGPPYPSHPRFMGNPAPFVAGGIEVLDRAMEWAGNWGLKVVIDLHAAPGCQNGFDNGGMLGVIDWHRDPTHVDYSLEVLERLAMRYKGHGALLAIEVLNEPHWDIPTAFLTDYTQKAYRRIRRHLGPEVAVIFHDGFRDPLVYRGLFQPPDVTGMILDIHRYQCFDPKDRETDIYGHIEKVVVERKSEADAVNGGLGLPAIVGEWSLGLDVKVVSLWATGPLCEPLEHLDTFSRDVALRAYGAAQLVTYERYAGWFFWSYRTETTPAWCFRECVNRGWLPERYF